MVRSGTLLEKGFFTVGTKLIHVPGMGMHVPGTRNVAPYHVPGDCAADSEKMLVEAPSSHILPVAPPPKLLWLQIWMEKGWLRRGLSPT